MIPVAVAVAAGAVSFGLARHSACARGGGADALTREDVLVRELGLSADQAARIRELHGRLSQQLDACCGRHCAARLNLARTLAAGTNGQAQAEAQLTEMSKAYEASERATLEHIRQVREVLTPGQRARFDGMMETCLCRSCGSRACGGSNESKEGDCR